MAQDDPAMWEGRKVVDPQGDKIGKVDDLFVDEETRHPEWLFVDTGMFGKNVFVPAGDARFPDDDVVQVPFSKDQVKDAPDIAAGDTLSTDDERRLYDYYGLSASQETSPAPPPESEAGDTERAGDALAAGAPQGDRPEDETARETLSRDGVATGPPSSSGLSGSPDQVRPGDTGTGVTAGRERVRVKKRIVTEPRTVYVEREEIVVERAAADAEEGGESATQQGNVREEVLYDEEITPEHEVDPSDERAA